MENYIILAACSLLVIVAIMIFASFSKDTRKIHCPNCSSTNIHFGMTINICGHCDYFWDRSLTPKP